MKKFVAPFHLEVNDINDAVPLPMKCATGNNSLPFQSLNVSHVSDVFQTGVRGSGLCI